MLLLKSVSIQNFKCYRKAQNFELEKATFFIGANNAGKSAVLKAVHCFFNDSQFFSEYLNKTEFRSKGSGANRSVIGVTFDFNVITTRGLQNRLKNKYGNELVVYKNFTYREATDTVVIDYTIGKESMPFDSLPAEILEFLSKISVSYIHPQEAKELLEKAQEKLKSLYYQTGVETPQLKNLYLNYKTSGQN